MYAVFLPMQIACQIIVWLVVSVASAVAVAAPTIYSDSHPTI